VLAPPGRGGFSFGQDSRILDIAENPAHASIVPFSAWQDAVNMGDFGNKTARQVQSHCGYLGHHNEEGRRRRSSARHRSPSVKEEDRRRRPGASSSSPSIDEIRRSGDLIYTTSLSVSLRPSVRPSLYNNISNDDELVLQSEGGSDERADVGAKEAEEDCRVRPARDEILLQNT
jgi:hypothetical protein